MISNNPIIAHSKDFHPLGQKGGIMVLANLVNPVYDLFAAQTKAVGFSRPYSLRRTRRPIIGGFFASALCFSAPLWAGYSGEGVSPAGTLGRRSANPAVCPPTLFSSRERVNKLIQGGHSMANISISARPEQTHSPFPLAARAARKAARQWFAGIPTQSLAEWRDLCRQKHCHGLPSLNDRSAAFDDAFAREIGSLIIEGSCYALQKKAASDSK